MPFLNNWQNQKTKPKPKHIKNAISQKNTLQKHA